VKLQDEDVQSIVGTQAERIFSGISEGEVDSKVYMLFTHTQTHT